MSILNNIKFSWDANGNIKWKLDKTTEANEMLYRFGGIALTDHLLATVKSENVISFCEVVLRGLANDKIEVNPINSELKNARLNFHRGKNIFYTTFKAKSKMFCDNQKLEQALSQMTQNYISKLLVTSSSEMNNNAVKMKVYLMIINYEHNIRKMHETNRSVIDTRKALIAASSILFLQKPQNVIPEKLDEFLDTVENKIEDLKNLPLAQGHGLFYKKTN
jgi:hypothetical protein